MQTTVNVVCYKSKTLSNEEHPLMIRLCQGKKLKYISLNMSIHPKYWDFAKSKPKRSYPNKEQLETFLNNEVKKYTDKIFELKSINKEFTLTSLVEKINSPQQLRTVDELFKKHIAYLQKAKRTGYAVSFQYVYKSLVEFNGHLNIYFSDIDLSWLKKYEAHQRELGLSDNTLGIRFRTLRALYNLAIEEEIVKPEYYPFRKFKVSRLHEETAKRAITKEDIKNIINYDCKGDQYLQLAIDLFSFSYLMGGINFVDIAYLTKDNIVDNRLIYKRRKTGKLIKFPIHTEVMVYVNNYQSEEPYLFPILSSFHVTEQQRINRVHKIIAKVNHRLKTVGRELNLPISLTTYVARHSYATVLKRSGVSTSIISESLGHSSEKVTQIYLDSFENSQIDEAMKNLL